MICVTHQCHSGTHTVTVAHTVTVIQQWRHTHISCQSTAGHETRNNGNQANYFFAQTKVISFNIPIPLKDPSC